MTVDVLALRFSEFSADMSSLSRAAASAGVKQATLSRRISSLEARLGFKLFDRSKRAQRQAYRLYPLQPLPASIFDTPEDEWHEG